MNIKKPIIPFICLLFILTGLQANAQIAILQNAIDKLGSCKNFSYKNVYKQKEEFSDTAISIKSFLALKTQDEKEPGYCFKFEEKFDQMKFPRVDTYNGKNFISYDPSDSTFYMIKSPAMSFSRSLPGQLNWIKTFLHDHPSKLTQSADTVISSVKSYHLIVTTRDTVINKEHLYTQLHLFFDKTTGLPVAELTRSRTDVFGKEITDYYTADLYSDYQIDQENISPANFSLPDGFHPPKPIPAEETALLAPGIVAPDWTLSDTEGKKTTLSQLKGKIVLLDFFFVGCMPCMNSLAPLDRLDKKYKSEKFVILSISDRDSQKLVSDFKKHQLIKNQMYANGNDVAKLYHITAGPTFYIIDKDGKIATAEIGYSDDFEQKMSDAIDRLIKKS